MEYLSIIRDIFAVLFILIGLILFILEIYGVFRFSFVLNRMHAAAMGDTLGIGFSLVGLMIMSGLTFTSLKFLLVIIFLWFSSPTSSHLIARLEVMTNEDKEEHYRVISLKELEAELEQREKEEEA